MVIREQNYRHSKSFMQKHPGIQPKMRSILLDWLIEVGLQLHLRFISQKLTLQHIFHYCLLLIEVKAT